MKPYKVDETAEQILEILSRDGKASPDDISRQINVPADTVVKHVKKMEADRIILGYHANINWQRIRLNDVKALIEVRVTPERGVGFDHVAGLIYRFPEVSSLTLLSGGYDLLVQVEGENLREVLSSYSSARDHKGRAVNSTHFMLKKYKEDGVIPSTNRLKRLPVSRPS